MRILMAVPKYPFPVVGGLERQAHELAKALVSADTLSMRCQAASTRAKRCRDDRRRPGSSGEVG